MMYDFHYPLGRGKLNEDTVNCRAKQSAMIGKMQALPLSLSLSHSSSMSFAMVKKEALLRLWGCDRSPSPVYFAALKSSLAVHKSGAAYSPNYPESSTCNKLSDRFHPDYITPDSNTLVHPAFSSPLTFTMALYLSICLPHIELLRKPLRSPKQKAGIIIRCVSMPSNLGV